MGELKLITVILNTNQKEDTLECLASLAESSYRNNRIIVLDNRSTDGSVEAIQSSFPEVQVIELSENRGYAGNNNIGIQAALAQKADWVLVLNEDTVLAPDCLEKLIEEGESDPRIGVLGPMVYHYEEPQIIQSAGGQFNRFWEATHIAQNEVDRGQFSESHPVGWISGCAILVRTKAIEQLGMFNEKFFIYWEETEWCLRIAKKGWRIVHVPRAKLWHKGVQIDYQPGPHVTYYFTRNRFLMFLLHRAPLSAWGIAWFITLKTLVSWTVKPKWSSKREHRDAMLQGIVDFLYRRWGRAYFQDSISPLTVNHAVKTLHRNHYSELE